MTATARELVRDLENRRLRAVCEGNTEALNELLAETLVYTHSNGSVDSKSSFIEGIRAGKWKYRSIERPIENFQVHGGCAIITGHARIQVEVRGAGKTLETRFLSVWVQQGNAWRMAAWQTTLLPA